MEKVARVQQSLHADLPGAGSILPTPGCSLLPLQPQQGFASCSWH